MICSGDSEWMGLGLNLSSSHQNLCRLKKKILSLPNLPLLLKNMTWFHPLANLNRIKEKLPLQGQYHLRLKTKKLPLQVQFLPHLMIKLTKLPQDQSHLLPMTTLLLLQIKLLHLNQSPRLHLTKMSPLRLLNQDLPPLTFLLHHLKPRYPMTFFQLQLSLMSTGLPKDSSLPSRTKAHVEVAMPLLPRPTSKASF
jgi:hypothetical protein